MEREVEDIEALIDATGGSAFVFGVSSGEVLALEAASELGGKVQKLFLYEPPFIVDDSRPPMPHDLGNQITGLVSEGHPSDAVKLFFTKGMGIPPRGGYDDAAADAGPHGARDHADHLNADPSKLMPTQ